jgi:hypothetical protein
MKAQPSAIAPVVLSIRLTSICQKEIGDGKNESGQEKSSRQAPYETG